MKPKVTIIILNWNGKEDTIQCLNSLKQITYPNYEILLVDNGSTDGSVEYLRKQYPKIEIIENGENLGFAEGNNVGIRREIEKGTDYVLLLNNDTVVDSDFLSELVLIAETDDNIGFTGPKVYYYDYNGKKDVINFAGGKLIFWKGKSYNVGADQTDKGQYDEVREVDYVQGSCLLAKIKMIKKIGMLDPSYFAYWEETDWCIRGNKCEFLSVYVPKAKIWHKIARSNVNSINEYYITRNRFIFMKKQASKIQYITFMIYFFSFQFGITTVKRLFLERKFNKYILFLKGIKDGINYNPQNI